MSAWEKVVETAVKAGKGAAKHPVATATGLGGAYAVSDGSKKIDEKSEDLMNHYTGKYGENLLEKVSEFRTLLKTAGPADGSFLGDVRHGVGGAIGKELISAGIGGLVAAAHGLKNMTVDRKKRNAILEQIIANDPVISRYAQEHPEEIEKLFTTMTRFAPTLSTDPHAVLAFLRNAIMMGGAIDYRTIQGLAEAEMSAKKALTHGGGSWR